MAGNYVEELAAFLGWEVDSSELKEFDSAVKDVTDTVKNVALAVGAAAAGVAAFVTMTNKSTAVMLGQAEAAGVSAKAVEDLGRMLSIVGIDSQQITKSFEFLNKTMGQIKSGATSAKLVDKSLQGVGLRFNDIKDLAPEEQFIQIMGAAQEAEDAQLAMGAATALFGRQAGKLAGYFRTQSKSVRELLEQQAKMNLQTDEGRAGALRFFGALDLLEAAAQSTRESIAGLVGEAMSPLMESWVEWIANNRELLRQRIKVWADRISIALKWLWERVSRAVEAVNSLVDAFGGLEGVLKIVGIAMAAVFSAKVISAALALANAVRAIGIAGLLAKGQMMLLVGIFALLFLLGEDLYHFFTGGESVLGKLGDRIAEFAHMNVRPFIASMLGMTPEELDLAMVRVVSSVTDFFTKSIPEAYAWLVEKVEDGIALLLDSIIPVAKEVFIVFKDMWGTMIDYIWSVSEQIINAITYPFRRGFEMAKGLISKLPGGDTLGAILPGSGAAPASAGVAASAAAQSAAASITNNSTRTGGNVNQSNTFNVTQLPGESGESFSRRVRDDIGQQLRQAKIATDPGVE